MTVVPVVLRDIERELDLVGASQLVIAGALIAFMIFRRQGLLGTHELRPSTWFSGTRGGNVSAPTSRSVQGPSQSSDRPRTRKGST